MVAQCLDVLPEFARFFGPKLGGGIAPLVANLLRERVSGSTSGSANNKVVLTAGVLKQKYAFWVGGLFTLMQL